jgi:hypothetical protein
VTHSMCVGHPLVKYRGASHKEAQKAQEVKNCVSIFIILVPFVPFCGLFGGYS